MHLLLEHFNNLIPPDAIIDHRNETLSLEIVLEGQAFLRELTQDNCNGGVLIVHLESERCLLRNIHMTQPQFTSALEKTIIAGFDCYVSKDLPRFTEDSRWSYMLANKYLIGLLTYEPAKIL